VKRFTVRRLAGLQIVSGSRIIAVSFLLTTARQGTIARRPRVHAVVRRR
jgi:hypothetical protein